MIRNVRLALALTAATALACGDGAGDPARTDGDPTQPDGPPGPPDAGPAGDASGIVVGSMGTCAAPEVIAVGPPILGDLGAGADGQSGGCVIGAGGHDAIFQLTPEITGDLRVVLSSDADLAVYARASCADQGSELDCGDATWGGNDEAITIPTTAGVPVFIIVDAYSADEAGPFRLAMAYTDAGAACSDPAPATVTNDGDNAGGSADLIGSCGGDGPETVYGYTTPGAPGDQGDLRIAARGATTDVVLYVRSTCADAGTELGCRDLYFYGYEEDLTIPLEGGTPVAIVVDSYAPAYAGAFSLTVDWIAAVCGDGTINGGECEPPSTPFCDASCRPIF